MFRIKSSSVPSSVHPRGLVQPLSLSSALDKSASLPITDSSDSPLSAFVGPSDSSYLTRYLYDNLKASASPSRARTAKEINVFIFFI